MIERAQCCILPSQTSLRYIALVLSPELGIPDKFPFPPATGDWVKRLSERETLVTYCGNAFRHFSQYIKAMKRGYSVWRGVGVCEGDTDPPTQIFPAVSSSLKPPPLNSENSQGDLWGDGGFQHNRSPDSCSRYWHVHKMPTYEETPRTCPLRPREMTAVLSWKKRRKGQESGSQEGSLLPPWGQISGSWDHCWGGRRGMKCVERGFKSRGETGGRKGRTKEEALWATMSNQTGL